MRSLLILAPVCGALVLAPSAYAGGATKSVECQHPLITGVEVWHLVHVSAATACPVAMKLYNWENKPGNMRKLFICKHPTGPVLVMHSFDGWELSITQSGRGNFQMARRQSSFYVGGTDFPVPCN